MDSISFQSDPEDQKATEASILWSDPNQKSINIAPDDAKARADKYSFALGDKSPGTDQIYNQVMSGREDDLRGLTAAQKSFDDQQTRLNLVREVASTAKQPLSKDQYDLISGLTNNQLANPDTVLESEYAKKVFSELYHTPEDPQNSVVARASVEDQSATDGMSSAFEDQLTKQEIVRSTIDDLNGSYQTKNKVEDFFTGMIPF
jgi:hypothetical protein